MQTLTAPALADWLAARDGRPAPTLLDVREPWEVSTAALPGIVHIPLRDIPARSGELDPATAVVCICHHGARSAQAGIFLESRGFTDIHNLQGGIDAWSRQVDPAVPTY